MYVRNGRKHAKEALPTVEAAPTRRSIRVPHKERVKLDRKTGSLCGKDLPSPYKANIFLPRPRFSFLPVPEIALFYPFIRARNLIYMTDRSGPQRCIVGYAERGEKELYMDCNWSSDSFFYAYPLGVLYVLSHRLLLFPFLIYWRFLLDLWGTLLHRSNYICANLYLKRAINCEFRIRM